jgi:outer membrane protein OmpA-like peptidoglycan-associated protein
MKKLFMLLLGVLPFLLTAQNNCDFFKGVEIKIDKTALNTADSDFGPAFVNDQLWYSAFTAEELELLKEGKKKNIFYNLFQSKLDKDGKVTGSSTLELEELSEGYHAGPVSYCAETKELFVTLSNFADPELRNIVFQKADIRLKIITAKEVNGVWELVEEFPFNNPSYSVGHPAISSTGDTLFFVSNNPELSTGKIDLFMSVRKDGKWGGIKNLGNKINTAGDEMFPFFFKNNTLIFASNGIRAGKPDLDLYYSCLTEDGFTEPVSIDQLNTEMDDFGLVIHENEKIGYLSSGRDAAKNEIKEDDIYKIEFIGNYELELVVLDRETMQPVEKPTVFFDDNVSGILSALVFRRALERNSTIIANVDAVGYAPVSKTITTVGKPFGIIRDTVLVDKFVEEKVFVLDNIHYDFDKWNILPVSEIELDKLVGIMNDYPKMTVELRSHTDCRGSDSYNELLSQKRSDSAVAYIIGKGIDKSRITAKGYGENELVNKCDDGVWCSVADHRENRRTDFKIISMK